MSEAIDLSKLRIQETHSFEFLTTTADYLGLSVDRSISNKISANVEQQIRLYASAHVAGNS